jgi:hypothetical protein
VLKTLKHCHKVLVQRKCNHTPVLLTHLVEVRRLLNAKRNPETTTT